MTLRVLSLFSGVGGIELGLERAGFETVAFAETDRFCSRVLAARWPGVPNLGDVRALGADGFARLGRARGGNGEPRHLDLLAGGFPCQDLSVAGKRAGLAGARSSLFFEFARVAAELRPRWLLVENVPGLLSSHRSADFAVVVRTLDELGYGLAWRVLDSRHFGVPQRRRRLFVVGRLGAECPTEVLFEPEGGGGHPAAGREAGEDIAYALAASVRGTGDQHGNAWNTTYALTAGDAKGGSTHDEMMNLVATGTGAGWWKDADEDGVRLRSQPGGTPENVVLAHTLRASGFDGGEDGTGRGIPLVAAISENQRAEVRETDYARQLTTGGGKPGQGYPAVRDGATVRRLTPTECERLQGFPDGWTCLEVDFGPDGLARFRDGEPYSTARCRCPDGPRYAALGNAVTVNVARWIGARILAAEAAR